MPRMIYHAAFRLNPDSAAASALRPVRMFEAFEQAGYEVFDLTGTSSDRKRKFKELNAQLKAGTKFDFMYSEAATIPVMLRDPNHFPHMLLDARIFATFKKYGIPMSVFYRDLYWAYDSYCEVVRRPLADVMRAIYRYELALYRHYMKLIFVPSVEMAQEIKELRTANVMALPPGAQIVDKEVAASPLRLFYVGGLGSHYRLHKFVNAVKRIPEVSFVLCAAENQWKDVEHEYGDIPANVRVVHASGKQLDEYYAWANVAAIAVNPSHYWSFAVPVKLFEYLGRGKPIIVADGTLASRIVQENGWGWTVDNDVDEYVGLLRYLSDHPNEVEERTEKVMQDRYEHTWRKRAELVRDVLTGGE